MQINKAKLLGLKMSVFIAFQYNFKQAIFKQT